MRLLAVMLTVSVGLLLDVKDPRFLPRKMASDRITAIRAVADDPFFFEVTWLHRVWPKDVREDLKTVMEITNGTLEWIHDAHLRRGAREAMDVTIFKFDGFVPLSPPPPPPPPPSDDLPTRIAIDDRPLSVPDCIAIGDSRDCTKNEINPSPPPVGCTPPLLVIDPSKLVVTDQMTEENYKNPEK
jgi:hypothetical protein